MSLTLYAHPFSSFCWKVQIALDADGTPYEYRNVDPAHPGVMDELTVQCEPAGAEVDPASLRMDVERVLREHLGIRVGVDVLDRGAVPRSEGKAVRVVDRR